MKKKIIKKTAFLWIHAFKKEQIIKRQGNKITQLAKNI